MKNLHKVVLATLIGLSSVATTSVAFAQQQSASATQDAMSEGKSRKWTRTPAS
jgi:hypothetical protein